MADDVTFVVHSEWLENIKDLPVEQQDKIIAEIVRFGAGLESQHKDDVMIQAFVNMVKSRINFSKNKYNEKVKMSKTAGRKKVINEDAISEMARQGLSAQEIAARLGCSKSTIDHSDGWKNRKNESKTEEESQIQYSPDFSF